MNWASFLVSIAGPFLVKAVIGLGIGVLTVTGIDLSMNMIIGWLTDSVGGIPSDMLNVLAISGVFQGIGYIGGAISARVAMAGAVNMKRFFIQ